MHRILLLFCLIVAAPVTRAADNTVAGAAPTADSTPLKQPGAAQGAGTPGEIAARPVNCPKRPPMAEGSPSAIVMELDPDTLWRPRGAEVRFTIRNPGGTVGVSKVRVCFGWSNPEGDFRPHQDLVGSPQVRAVSNNTGAVEYGATVPYLKSVPNSEWWPRRFISSAHYVFTGAFTVPVADMVVEVTTTSNDIVVTGTQVGVTSAIVAWVVVAVVGALVVLIVRGIARHRHVRGRNLLLQVISTQDGYASLSQFQIVLWTLVVGMSAIYVMTLSGNLISISDGTLVLLGIASAAALASRVPGSGQPVSVAAVPGAAVPGVPVPVVPVPVVPVPGMPAPVVAIPVVPATPEWSDLVVPDRATREMDVTRLQMLAFTLITAAFVVVKVVVDYEIPAIPTNFLVLMGISNGVYVGGRRLPSQPKNGGTAPEV